MARASLPVISCIIFGWQVLTPLTWAAAEWTRVRVGGSIPLVMNQSRETAVEYCEEWDEPPMVLAARMASRFELPRPVEAYDFPEKGNIHLHTFRIEAGPAGRRDEYLLQHINSRVFTRPDWVMEAMVACIEAQRRALARDQASHSEWEPITLIPTRQGDRYLQAESRRGRSIWRMMKKISDCSSYKSLGEIGERSRQLSVAEEAGRGLAIYGNLTADMDTSGLHNPLPGYRDTRLYYRQLRSVLAGNRSQDAIQGLLPEDPHVRHSTAEHFLVHLSPTEFQKRFRDSRVRELVDLALDYEPFGMTLLKGMEAGTIRRVAIHGDTKLDNFLFSATTGRVKALVDLDTILPHTWLADWGDMARSLCNLAGEKESEIEKVRVDEEIFEALARGFLATTGRATAAEIELMVEAAAIIALELGMRFLTDYLRGDNYFKLAATDPPDLNKVRARVQLTLARQFRERSQRLRASMSSPRNDSHQPAAEEGQESP